MIELDESFDRFLNKQSTNSSKYLEKYQTEISYNTFFTGNLETNKPCIFSSWLTENWLALKEWILENGKPNCQLLSELFGTAKVPVADCNIKHFNSQEKEIFIFKDYIKEFKNHIYGQTKKCLYLKMVLNPVADILPKPTRTLKNQDWHFVKAFPNYKAYAVPVYFASDWLNEFWTYRTTATDDYRFVYIGPKGSWTPFHADVFRSYSWSANICGRKRWIFYPPHEGTFLQNKFGELIYDVESAELRDSSMYPKSHLATGRIEVIQEKGETIFVPSNWYHQVWNLEDTISINHNWINSWNIQFVIEFFLSSLKEVETAISDYRLMNEWTTQCQLILKSVHGMDAKELYCFLNTIAIRRINYLKGDYTLSSFPEWRFGKNLVIRDARSLIWSFKHLQDSLPAELRQNLDESEENPSNIIDQLESLI